MPEFTVRGKILLPSNPASFPSPTHLSVTLSDTSIACAASVQLAKSVVEISEAYNRDGPSAALAYSLACTLDEDKIPYVCSVSATVSVGWTPDGQEWVRKGDYLNDTMHHVPLALGTADYEVDITLIHYNH